MLDLGGERWFGTRFVLPAGETLALRRKGSSCVSGRVLTGPSATPPSPQRPSCVWDWTGPKEITLGPTGRIAGSPPRVAPLTLSTTSLASEMIASGRVLLDVLRGDSALSVRRDETEQAWRFMTPVLRAWADELVPLEEYPAGSVGPPPLNETAHGVQRFALGSLRLVDFLTPYGA